MALSTGRAPVVSTLAAMKVALLRHSLNGAQRQWTAWGLALGLAGAGATWWVALRPGASPAATADMLQLTMAIWSVGWVVSPVLVGSGPLRPAELTLLGLPRRRLAGGLIVAAFIGVGALVTALAFVALVLYGFSLGAAPAAVSVVSFAAHLASVVVAGRLSSAVFGSLGRSRAGAALLGTITAVMMVVTQWGWMMLIAIDRSGVLATGLEGGLAQVLGLLPSSWGVVAIGAAQRQDWLLVTVALAGTLALTTGLVTLVSRAIDHGAPPRPTIEPTARGLARWEPRSAVGAVTRKELCSWSRDPARFQVLFVAPVFAVLLCLLPLSWGEHRALAYVGPLCAQTAALVSANLYGLDGTALWSLLLTPRATRADVLGRQVAWLAVFGLMSLVLGAIATGFAPQDQAWPAMAALTTVMVLGAAGVIVALGTMLLVPGPDPRRRADSPLDRGNTAGPAILAFFLTIVLAAPTGGVLYLAAAWEQPELAWAATLVGLLSGAGVCWGGGRLAARHLERHGSEMLQLLRAGTSSATAASAGPGARRRRDEMLLTFGAAGGSVALFPQALMPAVFKLDGTSGRLWFLALYLPDGWQWPCIVAMAALGVSGYVLAARVYRRGSVLTGPARS